MQSQPNRDPKRPSLTPAERELELALARLRPSRARLDRDRLIFEAGRLAERRRSRRWMAAAAALGLCALLAVVIRPAPGGREQVVTADRSADAAAPAEPPTAEPAASRGGQADGVSYRDLRAAMADDIDSGLSDGHAAVRPDERRGLPTLFFALFGTETHGKEDPQ